MEPKNKYKLILLILGVTAKVVHGKIGKSTEKPTSSNHFEPQVVPLCDKKSNGYIVEQSGEWVYDKTSTSCANTNMEILKVCQSMYTHRVITNIVQSNHHVKIRICKGKDRGCEPLWVKPYRCLESPFQSDALLVPSPCIFDHIHNSTQCWPSDPWNETALTSCNSRNMDLKSYAVLLPCGVGLFTGVEFVCCPRDNNNNNNNVEDDKDDSEYDDDDYDDDYIEDIFQTKSTTSTTTTTTTTTTTEEPQTDEYYKRYDSFNEHVNFKQAEHRLSAHHRSRINKVMNDWNTLETRYQSMKVKDPVDAENFKSQMTLKFQRTIKSLEAESVAEKKQLLAVHQQRVLSHINERKKEAMECFTSSLGVYEVELQRNLDASSVSTDRQRRCMERLMRALHKDRHHTISHYRHIVKSNPNEAYAQRDLTINRLTQISSTARQALQMLDRYDTLSKYLRPLIEDYVLSLQGRDDPPGSLLTATKESETILIDQLSSMTVSSGVNREFTTMSTSTTTKSTTSTISPETIEQQPESNNNNQQKQQQQQRLEEETLTDSSTSESRIEFEAVPQPAHSQQNIFSHEPSYSVRRTVYHKENKSVYVTMAFAGIAIFGAMVIGLVVLRRRHPRHQGFLEVNTMNSQNVTTPEEKHVQSMQINGYENPTYKYFETKE